MSSDTTFTATGPGIAGYQTNGLNLTEGANMQGTTRGVIGECVGTNGIGVQGVGSGSSAGVAGFGGPNAGMGVLAQGGANGGVAIQAEGTVAHIRMIPSVSVGTGNPNTAKIPGEPGDLLAVSKQPDPILLDDTVASLWFNAGGATPWKQLF
jgi:hypothetical protein